MTARSTWQPPAAVALEDMINLHHEVTAMPDIAIDMREDIFRIRELEMDWDIGAVIYEPQETKHIPIGPDGKKVGVFLLHGGVSDFKSVERIARTLPSKFGIKVATMTFPGRFYFRDADRDWPGDVENADGTARTPLWTKEMQITPGPVHDRPGHFEARRLRHAGFSFGQGRHGIFPPHGRLARRFRSKRSRKPPGAIFPRANSRFTFTAIPPAGRSP